MDRVHVKRLRIDNVLGIEHLELEPGKITVLSGPNESGKTSVLEAIASVVGGGHDATLLRKGAERGEVVLVLDNGVELRKTITQTRSELEARSEEAGKFGSPQTYVRSLVSVTGFNPVAFIDADDKTRIAMLLRAVPVQVPAEDIAAAVAAVPDVDIAKACSAPHPIERLSQLARHIYDGRTGDNRIAKEKEAMAAAMATALPPEAVMAQPWETKIKTLNADLESAVRDEESMRARREADVAAIRSAAESLAASCRERTKEASGRIRSEASEFCAHIDGKLDAFKTVVQAELAEAIRKLEDDARARIAAETAEATKRIAAQNEEATVQLARLKAEEEELAAGASSSAQAEADSVRAQWDRSIATTSELIGRLRAELSEATAYAEQVARARQAQKARELLLENARQFAQRAEAATAALEALEVLKRKALASFPIAGLSVDPATATISLNGVPFDRLSEAQRVEVAFAVAKVGLGKLPIMCVDGLERLDDRRFEAFRQRAAAEDIQLFVTRVDEGAFQVATE